MASVEAPPCADEADSAVALPLPSSDCSSGICTLRRGRGGPARRLLEREGGAGALSGADDTDDMEARGSARFNSGGDEAISLSLPRDASLALLVLSSTDDER